MEKNEEYWRSSEGADEYERLLDDHFHRLFQEFGGDVEILKRLGEIEILAMNDYPLKGVNTVITKGMSRFILDTDVRVEQAMTLRREYSKTWAADLLTTLAAAALQNRRPLAEHSVIANVDFSGIGGAVQVQHLIVLMGHWLEEREFKIPNYFPGYVLEFVPILDSEAKVATANMETFYQWGRDGLIDTLDLRRADLGSAH